MSSKILVFLSFWGVVANVRCDKTPALIWSSSRPLSDLSQTFAGETINTKDFQDNYLKPLTSSPSHALVIFMQNKLSVEDFTRHADVYSVNSDGGAFKNVKSAMDEQYSVHLPAVSSPKSAIDDISSSFTGEVIRVDNPESVDNLDLAQDKSYLIIVTLKPVNSQDEYGSFMENDAMIGKCVHHLNKRGVKFSAIYTAESSSQMANSERHGSRQLMAADEDAAENSNGTLWAVEDTLLFLESVSLTVEIRTTPDKKGSTWSTEFPYLETTATTSTTVNDTISLDMTLTGENGTLELNMMIAPVEDGSMWKSTGGSVAFVANSQELEKYNVSTLNLDYKIESINTWCFHCSKLTSKPLYRGYNDSKRIAVELVLNRFQIQVVFNSTDDLSKNLTFSGDVWDCVEFFTVPIWSGIIVTLIIVIVLFYGITMLTNITTMDRFDDPKAKTITVTVNE